MENLLRNFAPGVHIYSPFSKSPEQDPMPTLQKLCRNAVLKHVTLRRLTTGETSLHLPKRLWKHIAELSTADLKLIECAPTDAFNGYFFYKALTYKVLCLCDEQQYMVTYGYSKNGEVKKKADHDQWVKIRHKNFLSVYATVTDESTQNVFYIYDQPHTSLEELWEKICEKQIPVPDAFFIRLTSDLYEALLFLISKGLQRREFCLHNIYIMNDRLVLENGSMCKALKTESSNGEYMLIEILKLLLTKDSFHSKTVWKWIKKIEYHKCFLRNLNENGNSFSFGKLIQNLKG
ncbi:hypothetical protein JTE90_024288 [Oedothorax gibbosus]|uniref:SOCS box domain-containing protein n=1 Tax=Oedothorax gibbosus TaxID=931172 RepID=A0AAV6VY77_9ARAC|nr:hypothetical protein JTE90_024288 [Oedothorax gibbosus]